MAMLSSTWRPRVKKQVVSNNRTLTVSRHFDITNQNAIYQSWLFRAYLIFRESDSLFSPQNPKTEDISLMAEIPDSADGDSGFFRPEKSEGKMLNPEDPGIGNFLFPS